MRKGSCEAIVIPEGPILMRGVQVIYDDEGAHATRRSIVAVCACGLTQRPPWCDGTHKVAGSTPSP